MKYMTDIVIYVTGININLYDNHLVYFSERNPPLHPTKGKVTKLVGIH